MRDQWENTMTIRVLIAADEREGAYVRLPAAGEHHPALVCR
jgi:hypothetical protein